VDQGRALCLHGLLPVDPLPEELALDVTFPCKGP
jgi:hypothetical protein